MILAIIHALNRPAIAATRIVITSDIPKLNPHTDVSSAANTPENAATDPGDRSFRPAIIKYVSPIATRPTRLAATKTLIRLV